MTYLRLPLVVACLALLAGLLPGLRYGGPPLLPAALSLVCAALPFALARLRRTMTSPRSFACVLLSVAFAGAALGTAGRADAAADCRAGFEDELPMEVTGTLAANHIPPADSLGRVPILPVEATAVTARAGVHPRCAVELRVKLPRGTEAMRAGTEVRLRGTWWKMQAPVVPSAWPGDPARAGFLAVKRLEVTRPPSAAAHPLLVARGSFQARLHRLFGENGPLADALLLGRRETLDRELSVRFAQSGLVHLLAISGTHVALIGAVLVVAGRAMRVPRRIVPWATIVLVALYLAMIGAPPSAVRSGIMVALTLAGAAIQRPSASLPVVAASAVAILAFQPAAALDAGFQLSYAGVLGILLLRRAMLQRVPEAWRKGKVTRPVVESAVVSVAAFLATAPIVAAHFSQVAPVSIVANLPAVPLTSVALVGVGAAALLDPVAPPLARAVAWVAGLALDLLERVVDVAVAVPGGHATVSAPHWPAWIAAGVAFLLVMDAAAKLRPGVRWLVAAGVSAAVVAAVPALAPRAHGVEIAFLDVGQGDAVAIRSPAGRWVLVDAGPRDDGWDAGERRVLPFLRARGVRRLEALVLTHPHADHVGGAAAVLREMPVGRVIDPGLPLGSPVYDGVVEAAQVAGTTWTAARAGRVLRLDGMELAFLWPGPDLLDGVEDPNEISAVIRLRYGAFAAVLTGDAGEPVEQALVARHGAGLRADVLKLGHHGSRTSTSPAFLGAVRPALAVVSAGRRNDFGHPHAVVMERLARRGVEVARTDRDGTVVVEVDPGGAWARASP
jgi:competence protein ComEC